MRHLGRNRLDWDGRFGGNVNRFNRAYLNLGAGFELVVGTGLDHMAVELGEAAARQVRHQVA
jgi:hypothetical protein